jgi:hypothetical protein
MSLHGMDHNRLEGKDPGRQRVVSVCEMHGGSKIVSAFRFQTHGLISLAFIRTYLDCGVGFRAQPPSIIHFIRWTMTTKPIIWVRPPPQVHTATSKSEDQLESMVALLFDPR